MEQGQEDSFSKRTVNQDEYLNLSRIDQPERPQRDMLQPPVGRQQPPASRTASDWSVPATPSVFPTSMAPQPEAMNFMQMMNNPMMMGMMMAQFQAMHQQMMNSSVGRLPPQDGYHVDSRTPLMEPVMRQPPPRNRSAQFETFEVPNQPQAFKQPMAGYQSLPSEQSQPRVKKVSVRGSNPSFEHQNNPPSSVPEGKPRGMPLATDELMQRQSTSGLGKTIQQDTSSQYSQTDSRKELAIEAPKFSAIKPRPEVNIEQHEAPQMKQQPSSLAAKKPISFDDMPIRPMKNEEFSSVGEPVKQPQLNTRTKAAHNPFDEMPVGGKSSFNKELAEYANPPASVTYEQIKAPRPQITRNSEVQKPNPYRDIEDRPVKGISMKFEEMVQQKIGKEPISMRPEEEQQHREPRISNFLKKGSRQFLSSAKYRAAGQSQPKQEQIEVKAPPKKTPKQSAVNNSIMRDDEFAPKAQFSVAGKSKQPFKPKVEEGDSRQKSPNVARRKLIDTEEYPHDRSEPRKERVATKQALNKQKKTYSNIFEDEHSEPEEERIEICPGIKLEKWKMEKLKEHFALESESVRIEQQRLNKLRSKYEEMLRVLESQREQNAQKLQQDREQFEQQKKEEMKQIKNERRVAERQKQAVCSTTNKKEKEELEAAKKEWEKEKEDFKKRQNSSRILIEKLKREIEELKRQMLTSSTANYPEQKKQHTKPSQIDVSVEKDARDIRETRKPLTTSKRPQATHEDREQSREETTSNKPHHKSILNPDGKYSEQKQVESRRNNHSEIRQEGVPVKEVDKTKTSESAFQTATNNSSISNRFIPDYEDLKTDRAKNQPIAGTAKGHIKNPPSTLEQRHKPVYQQDRFKFGWEVENQSRSNRSRSNISHSSEEESFEPYHEDMDVSDLNNIRNLSVRMVTPEMIEDLLHYYNTREYQKLQQLTRSKQRKVLSEEDSGDKVTKTYADGVRETLFRTGIRKEVLGGYTIIHFKNKDIKQKLEDGTTLYYFSEKEVDQITLLNRVNIFRFDNDQVEFHFPDGRIEIRHADGSIKIQRKD